MCYSAQVVQVVRKFYRELGIRLDYAEAERLFLRRLDDAAINISRGFEANFDEPADEAGRRIQAAIVEHRTRTATKLEKDLFTQKTRLVGAERSLAVKETKKARDDRRIATNKIESISGKLSDLRRREPRTRDNRIFPMVHAGVIIRKDGENLLTPLRYGCRPAGMPAFYDKKFPGLYNARRDNLEKFWRGQFGVTHAVLVVEWFYENVALNARDHRSLGEGEQACNVVLQFTPEPPQQMLVACLWSHWTDSVAPDVRSFAAITDDPPPAIAAAGHDRCIINLRPENVAAWLTPAGRSTAELQAILSDPAVSVYQHSAADAA